MTTKLDDSHRRSATRAPIDRPIKLQFDDSMDVIEGHCRNLSIGGMFILFEKSRPAGSLVRFELELSPDSAIRGLGEVVWIKAKSGYGGSEAGFGLKFRFLEQQDRQLIFKLVSQHIKERLSKREPTDKAALSDPEVGEEVRLPADGLLDSLPSVSAEPHLPEIPEFDDESLGEAPIESETADDGANIESQRETLRSDLKDHAPPQTLDAIGLDPSVGETPIYELGLGGQAESQRPSFFDEPDASTALNAEASLGSIEDSSRPPTDVALEHGADLQAMEVSEDESMARGREFSILPVLGILLVAGAAAFYLFRDEIPVRFGGTNSTAVASTVTETPGADTESTDVDSDKKSETIPGVEEEVPPAVSGPVAPRVDPHPTGLKSPAVEESSGTARQSSPVALRDPQTSSLDQSSRESAEENSETRSPTDAESSSVPSQSLPSPAAQVPAVESKLTQQFSRLEDISWASTPDGGLKIILKADGAIPTGRYSYFRLSGDSPREVIKLVGVRKKFSKSVIEVGAPAVHQIRTGFHRKQGSTELHIVIDLAGRQWKLAEVRNIGAELELLVAPE